MLIENNNSEQIQFLSKTNETLKFTHLQTKDYEAYNKCFYGCMSIEIGDVVLIRNTDIAESDSIDGCYIGRILHLYELFDVDSRKDPCRAIVQWYSRPKDIPHKFYDDDSISIDFKNELIEEYREYDPDISIETIFRKCIVIMAGKNNFTSTATEILQKFERNKKSFKKLPTYVCRYKFIKVKNVYKLISLNESGEEIKSAKKIPNRGSSRKSMNNEKQTDVAKIVSPLKLSNICNSPGKSFNCKVKLARRNLNLSLENDINSTAGSDILNYSIINNTPDGESDIKIKLRLSAKHRLSTNTELKENVRDRKRSTDENTLTPNKKIKESYTPNSKNFENTPIRKSILKTPGGKNSVGTPRRSILLSNIIEERIIQDDSVICTPKRAVKQKLSQRDIEDFANDDDDCDDYIPKSRRKSVSADTPKSHRKSISTYTPKSVGKRKHSGEEDYKPIYEDTPSKKSIYMQNVEYPQTPRRRSVTKQINVEVTPHRRSVNKPKFGVIEELGTPSRKSKSEDKSTLTPSQKLKSIRSVNITPSIKSRIDIASNRRQSDLQIAREKLHVSAIPDSLPCREEEYDNIFSFLRDKIMDKTGGCMYVSGVPGTGKTATTTGVIRYLKELALNEEIPEFEFVEINGMKLTEPRQAYVQIYKQLTGKTLQWEQAHSLLEKRFSTPAPRRTTTVILVDELDILCNRRQDVVYNLLDWPSKSAAKLVVISIANTMDLPERLLMGKVTSRLGLTRLTFQPYTHKQLQEIVVSRLNGSGAFKGDAIQLVARKVAAVSGDARRALDICRRATEIAEENSKEKIVTVLNVEQASKEMISSAKVQAIKKCSRLEQVFLQAVVAEVTRTGVDETVFHGVYCQIESIAAFMGLPVPSPGRALKISAKLSSERLLICEHSRTDIFQKILLNVSTDDIHYALQVNVE